MDFEEYPLRSTLWTTMRWIVVNLAADMHSQYLKINLLEQVLSQLTDHIVIYHGRLVPLDAQMIDEVTVGE